MKSGRFFWGVLLVVVGVLFLLNVTTDLDLDLDFYWRLWPLLFVFWGIAALTKEKAVRLVLAGLTAVLVGVIAFWFFSFQWADFDFGEVEFSSSDNVEYLSEPLEQGVERASLDISTGAGKLLIEGTTQQLIEARAATSYGYYVLQSHPYEDAVDLDLYLQGRGRHFPFKGFRNELEVKLNPDLLWDLRLEVGAIKSDVDLSPYAVESLVIESGASSSRIRLGDRADYAKVKISTGVSNVTIEIPESVGCEIEIDAPLSSRNFQGFTRVGSGVYESEGYSDAKKKISIEIDAGFSKFRVRRYEQM